MDLKSHCFHRNCSALSENQRQWVSECHRSVPSLQLSLWESASLPSTHVTSADDVYLSTDPHQEWYWHAVSETLSRGRDRWLSPCPLMRSGWLLSPRRDGTRAKNDDRTGFIFFTDLRVPSVQLCSSPFAILDGDIAFEMRVFLEPREHV